MQTKIVLSSISFGLAHQCSILHSFEQRQKIVLLISNYFYRAHRARIFVSNYFFININTLAILATKISCYILSLHIRSNLCCLGMQTKIVLSSISFGLVHQCSVLHSFEQRQKIVLLISNYFYRAHRARIFV